MTTYTRYMTPYDRAWDMAVYTEYMWSYIWNPDTLDELGHTRSYSVRTVFIPSMTMPYDEHCMYLVILAIVSTSLYIPVHTDRCQKSKLHTLYVQNAKFYTEMYTVCTFTMFCTYIVCTLYVHCSYSGGDIAVTFERALTRTRDVEVHFSLPLFPSA